MKEFYQMSSQEVREGVNGSQEPLSQEQVQEHQQKFGFNELVEGKKKSTVQIFFEQFMDFLVIILIAAAIVSGFLGDIESTVVILVVITMNAIIGTIQTVKAEHSLNSLKQLSAPMAKVLRHGVVTEVASREVTVGDEVILEAGDYVPADGRILTSASMKIDESALTGESVGVDKQTEVIAAESPLGDRKNMVFSGSFVTYGRGSFLVTDIGMKTEMGKIAGLLKTAQEKKTPLQINLDQFGKKLSIIIIAFCVLLFGVSIFRGESPANAFLFAVALAVAAIPEALSSIVTIVLSFGTQKMAKEGAIIRKLQAVEGLGSVSVICSDKTGTLTQNKMTVEYYYVEGKKFAADQLQAGNPVHKQVLRCSILCNDSTNLDGEEIGDPTETALINLGDKMGVPAQRVRTAYPRLSELPFDSDRKLMTTSHLLKTGYTMITKGATDVLLDRISRVQKGGEVCPLSEEDKKSIAEANEGFSKEGLRVLGVAYKPLDGDKTLELADENDLIFLGLIAMMDPPREESKAAVAECIRAGIKPVMITGDHKVTAAAIAKRIGILKEDSEACEGAAIDGLSEE
ncbi:MAG: HAD family hydrolase, partial [Clostridia bacterium]|nr:HAD family hydrolase [Clostridia bacterium]